MTEMDIKKMFYSIAVYGNFHWKAHMTQAELFEATDKYYEDFIAEPNGNTMKTLVENLREDALNGSGDAKVYMDQLIGLINMESEVRV